jgi:alkylhydroperoxidase family enzyme
VKAIQTSFRTAPIDAKTYALLDYAERATRDATTMTADDLERLRQAGFSDDAIVDAVSIMGFFQMANFHADVLGLAINPEYATMAKVEGMRKV